MRARKNAVVRRINRRGQVLRVGIDGVAEEDELEQRNADHHGERDAVAAHLDEFLADDRPEPLPVEFVRLHESASADEMADDE